MFRIQASQPRSASNALLEDSGLSDALQSVFPMMTEAAILVWNGGHVPLSYKYDLSFMVDDILYLAEALLSTKRGQTRISWPTNTFAATWNTRWADDIISIHGDWKTVVGGTEELLRAHPLVEMPVGEFLAEGKRPLTIMTMALTEAGYDRLAPQPMERLAHLASQIQNEGVLYR
jgi:hypothetical protein